VVALRIFVERVTGTVSPIGLETEPYTIDPVSFVISKRLVEEALSIPITRAEIVSVPFVVWNVNESIKVGEPPGRIVTANGSTPVVKVVVPLERVVVELSDE
jgi:hypothetical protein